MADDRTRALVRATRGGDIEAAETLLWELLRSGRLLSIIKASNVTAGPREALPWIHNGYVVGGVRLLGWAGWKGAQPLLDEIQNTITATRLPDQPSYKLKLGSAAGDMPLRGHGRSGATLRPYTKLGEKVEEEISPHLGVYAAAQGLKAIDADGRIAPLLALATRFLEAPSARVLFPGAPYKDERVQRHNALLAELSRAIHRDAQDITYRFPNIYSDPTLNSHLTTHAQRSGWCYAEAIREFARAAELVDTANSGKWSESLFFAAEYLAWRCEPSDGTASREGSQPYYRIYRPAWSSTDRHCVNPTRGCATQANRIIKKAVLDPCLIWHALWCAGEKPPEITPGAAMTFPNEASP